MKNGVKPSRDAKNYHKDYRQPPKNHDSSVPSTYDTTSDQASNHLLYLEVQRVIKKTHYKIYDH